MEHIDPNKIIINGLKNCVILAGISHPNIILSTFLSAKRVNAVPEAIKKDDLALRVYDINCPGQHWSRHRSSKPENLKKEDAERGPDLKTHLENMLTPYTSQEALAEIQGRDDF